MIATLAILVISALLTLAADAMRRGGWLAQWVAVLGALAALAVSLATEGWGGAVPASGISLPSFLVGPGAPPFRSDALSTGIGAWCLLIGALCLLAASRMSAVRLASGLLILATLYSIAHTWDLRFFAVQALLLVPLLVLMGQAGKQDESSENRAGSLSGYATAALGIGALLFLGAALIIGRTAGGEYNLAALSLSALTRWPLVLVAVGSVFWLGLAPVTGWSARGGDGATNALLQGLVTGVPVAVLLLRLQALITAQGLAGSLPEGWAAFTGSLVWLGAATVLVAGAGAILHAGTGKWSASITALNMGLVAWGLGLDSPAGRQAALATLLAYGLIRATIAVLGPRDTGAASAWHAWAFTETTLALAALPATAGFVGIWLLGAALAKTTHPSVALVLLAGVLMSACGTALHVARRQATVGVAENKTPATEPREEQLARAALWAGTAGALATIIGGIVPGLWLPQVAAMSTVAGGASPVASGWLGLDAGGGLLLPALMLALGGALLVGLAWLVALRARANTVPTASLLATALARLETGSRDRAGDLDVAGLPVPAPVWWLSLTWLEGGVSGLGVLLFRLGRRAGLGLGRLEGRYYLPLALIFMLVALLAITR